MEKCFLILLVIIFSFIVSKNANAGVYIFGTVGSGGEVDAASYGGEIGAIWPKDEPKYLLGVGASNAESGEREPYSVVLDKVRDDELEIYGAAGIGLVKSFFIVGTAGASFVTECLAFKGMDCSGMDDADEEVKFAVSGQLRFVYKNLMIGAGYHNRRGIIGGIGFAF